MFTFTAVLKLLPVLIKDKSFLSHGIYIMRANNKLGLVGFDTVKYPN